MCSIIGAYNWKNSFEVVQAGLKKTSERGRDGCGYYDGDLYYAKTPSQLKKSDKDSLFGHNLHAIVNTINQPIKSGRGILVANCEIYNWEELAEEFELNAKNDSDLLLKLLNKVGVEKTLEALRGVYSFAYWERDTVWIARDIIGVKPLWYAYNGRSLLFASEKKAISGYVQLIEELNPRSIIKYDVPNGKLEFIERKFFDIAPEVNGEKLGSLVTEAIKVRIPDRKFGLLFSGGVDSVIIAKVLKDLGCSFTCYTAATSEDSPDLVASKEFAKELGLDLKYKVVKDTEKYLEKIVPLIEDNNVVKVGVALPLYIASELAKKDGNKVIFSGSGADELFAGYDRYKKVDDIRKLNKDCYSDILKIYERNNYRDDVITMNNNLELRVPFLDKELVAYALRISPELKIKSGIEKHILRELAISLGISEPFAFRKKKAAQYGSGFDKSIMKLAKEEGKTKSEYLKKFYNPGNVKLAALVSSGKDSVYAMYTMICQNYDVGCMVTMRSKNPDSFMFQSQGVDMSKLQSESFGIPLIEKETEGKEEEEIEDLKEVLIEAKEKFGIEGVVSGALYSNYQRERIDKVCDTLGLKIFSPLWHIDQEHEMRDLIKKGFRFMLVKVAADGLSSDWLGKIITNEDIDKLVQLNERIGFNIAGEGGEFETLMVDGPIFTKRIIINSSEVVMENEHLGVFNILDAHLE